MIFLLWLLPLLGWCQPLHWSNLIEVTDRHEFYANNQTIVKPRDSWQTLFSVVYPDRNLKILKDCVFYRVPGDEAGHLKIVTVSKAENCELPVETKKTLDVGELKALQFSVTDKAIQLNLTDKRFHVTEWKIAVTHKEARKSPELFLSSAAYRSPKLIMLAPATAAKPTPGMSLKSGEICHAISDDCKELKPSVCSQCPGPWFEVPNGCTNGPKYCGTKECGKKDGPACRRGMKFQGKGSKFDCRVDASFAFCAPGLTVTCDGQSAWCR